MEINDAYTYEHCMKYFLCVTDNYEHGDGGYFRLYIEHLTYSLGVVKIRFKKTYG
jgi:hypothetical protein